AARGGGSDRVPAALQSAHDRVVEHPHAPGGDGAHRQLGVAGRTQLAHEEGVEWCPEPRRDLRGDGHASAGETQHDDVVTTDVVDELARQHLSGVRAVAVTAGHGTIVALGDVRPAVEARVVLPAAG